MDQRVCKLPECNNIVTNWRKSYCCRTHQSTHSARIRFENYIPKEPKKYKDYSPEQKGKHVAKVIARKNHIKLATPQWANINEINAFYVQAQKLNKETGTPHEVDHIIPIINELVCGLHVPANLQILTEKDNQKKSNQFVIG